MKTLVTLALLVLTSQQVMAKSQPRYCHTLYGELELVVSVKGKHLFLAPHSLDRQPRQMASTENLTGANFSSWNALSYKTSDELKVWSQNSLNFKSDFKSFIEVSDSEGRSHTFSLSCSRF